MEIIRYILDQFRPCRQCGHVGDTLWIKLMSGGSRDLIGRRRDVYCYLCPDCRAHYKKDK